MSATRRPRSAAMNAAPYPPGPPPTTATCVELVSPSIFDYRHRATEGTEKRKNRRIELAPIHPPLLSVSLLLCGLSLQSQQQGLFQSLGHPAQEARGIGAVDQAVIVR